MNLVCESLLLVDSPVLDGLSLTAMAPAALGHVNVNTCCFGALAEISDEAVLY